MNETVYLILKFEKNNKKKQQKSETFSQQPSTKVTP